MKAHPLLSRNHAVEKRGIRLIAEDAESAKGRRGTKKYAPKKVQPFLTSDPCGPLRTLRPLRLNGLPSTAWRRLGILALLCCGVVSLCAAAPSLSPGEAPRVFEEMKQAGRRAEALALARHILAASPRQADESGSVERDRVAALNVLSDAGEREAYALALEQRAKAEDASIEDWLRFAEAVTDPEKDKAALAPGPCARAPSPPGASAGSQRKPDSATTPPWSRSKALW